jgi:hypothetical protein
MVVARVTDPAKLEEAAPHIEALMKIFGVAAPQG